MGNEIRKTKGFNKKHRNILIGFAGVFFHILIFVITNLAGAVFSPNWIESLIISAIMIGFALICWIIVTLLIYAIISKRGFDDADKSAIVQEISSAHGVDICPKNNELCCLSKLLKIDGLRLTIDKQTKLNNRLYDKDDVYNIEHYGMDGHEWTHIWIFSENLETELDLNNEAELVVRENLSKNIQYTMFYLFSNDEQKDETERRKQLMLNSVKQPYRKNLRFVPLNVAPGYIGNNTLPLLCGAVLYSNRQSTVDGLPYFSCGYLSMRNNVSDDAVFYKMPRCMLSQYAAYFKNIYKSQGEN